MTADLLATAPAVNSQQEQAFGGDRDREAAIAGIELRTDRHPHTPSPSGTGHHTGNRRRLPSSPGTAHVDHTLSV